VLPLLYPTPDVRDKLLADPLSAPIPTTHRELFRFAARFVRRSWETTPADLQRLRDAGLSEAEIVNWATLGSTQSWFTMSADGGGIPLEGEALTGPGVGRARAAYEAMPEGLLAGRSSRPPAAPAAEGDRIAWVGTDETGAAHDEVGRWASERYGFVPNLLRALSLQPGYYRRHRLALELLESPQSQSLSPRQHAMVRALVSELNRCRYSERTTAALLERRSGDPRLSARVRTDREGGDWEPVDRVVLDFARKMACNSYKVTEKDAISFREVGLDDEAYVDVLNTVSIQTSLDRLANTLGVTPDEQPLIPG
jgi:uncharacterized peroxidase-related enzyme